ncbi:hypothetical protein CONCODRAFT_11102 [Conidiobolus coronatus NRRL 28638]|uniref:Uncharacterized protein n=1 Tax=Conidiobolus coronatus (strain ATCC 28846 / CBS 209.66 / NRRL 28638) TaxID=796925 RepID=A0A137NWE2_CONC2|nr:hypothetical protein CONCODRAFT_11102 [Conidiobolus coronatus NRRL 28638]|eukprot:KXN66934.1 hypothetical protein CONCODRAFT_11102 [Conidiobolus coronatus NRRL 28638]
MQLISTLTIIATLLTQAWSIPSPDYGNPPAQCYGGGMRQYPPLVNPNTPPCWYLQPDGQYDCYDYLPGTYQCPWAGILIEATFSI